MTGVTFIDLLAGRVLRLATAHVCNSFRYAKESVSWFRPGRPPSNTAASSRYSPSVLTAG